MTIYVVRHCHLAVAEKELESCLVVCSASDEVDMDGHYMASPYGESVPRDRRGTPCRAS